MDLQEARALAVGLRKDAETLDGVSDHLEIVAGDTGERWAESVRRARLDVRSAAARIAAAAAIAKQDATT